MAYEGMTVLEVVDQAVQRCQETEADADVALAVVNRMADEAQQVTADLETASEDTLVKLEALERKLEIAEQSLEALGSF